MRLIIFLACLVAYPAFAEMIPKTNFYYGSWQGAAYTSDETGRFSHCAISAQYNHGNTLLMSINADATVNVAVQTPEETFTENEEFPVALYIDRRQPFYGNAWATDSRFAILTLNDIDSALLSLKKGRTLIVQSKYGEVPFDLSGTSRALEATLQCAVQNQHYSDTAPQNIAQLVDPALLMQVATGTITKLGASDFLFLSEAEMLELYPNATAQKVFWSSPSLNLLAGVLVVEAKPDVSLKASDTNDLSLLSNLCSGDFVTGVRQVIDQNVEMREISAKCKETDGKSEHYLTKFLLNGKQIYTWLWFLDEPDTPSNASRSLMAQDAAIYAASYIKK